MNRSGSLKLIKTTLLAVPVYTSISLSLPPLMHKGTREDHDSVPVNQNIYFVERQMFGCMKPGTKTTTLWLGW
jgi:hypothetical protein